MAVSITEQTEEFITLELKIPFSRSMIDSEQVIQDTLNEAGVMSTGALLKHFDTEGLPLMLGSVKLTSMGLVPKYYQTPYGVTQVERHVYQTAKGGATFCPLEKEARIILTATPRFASQVSHKMASQASGSVVEDLEVNHGRKVSKNVVQRLTDVVSAVVQLKEESWSYTVPSIKDHEVATVSVGLDGTCMLMCDGGYRQAMVGTIALYDKEGKRQHTTYIAASPEYGKSTFKTRLSREIGRAKQLYSNAEYIGVADGAHDNWSYLEQYTDKQILDFYHATEYITQVADQVFSSSAKKRKAWLDGRCHELKHTQGAAQTILTEMKAFKEEKKLNKKQLTHIDEAITYFQNNIDKSRMNYAEHVANNKPIGSGVTEAACKTIVKQRLCQSGMRWKEKGAAMILSLRALVKSTGRWQQFWRKINQYGFPVENFT